MQEKIINQPNIASVLLSSGWVHVKGKSFKVMKFCYGDVKSFYGAEWTGTDEGETRYVASLDEILAISYKK